MNKQEQIQQEVNAVILTIKTLPSFGKMNSVTQKAQKELRELGLAEYVPSWMMEKGAKCDRIINGLIEAAKEDGNRRNHNNRKDNEGENTTAIGNFYPVSTLWTLMNNVTETVDEETETEIATREDVISADEQVFNTSNWNPDGMNSVSFWQDVDGDLNPFYRNHWYVTRQDAHSSVHVHIGHTKKQVAEWISECLTNTNYA